MKIKSSATSALILRVFLPASALIIPFTAYGASLSVHPALTQARRQELNEQLWSAVSGPSIPEARIRQLLQEGASPRTATPQGYTVLMAAAFHNPSPAVIEILLKAGADVSASIRNGVNIGLTPLMLAAFYNPSPAVSRVLIAAGADVNRSVPVGPATGANALLFSFHNPNPAVMETLIKAGADINRAAVSGLSAGVTPLMFAAQFSKNPAFVKILLQAGANPRATDNFGNTVSAYAAKNKSPAADLIKKLINQALLKQSFN